MGIEQFIKTVCVQSAVYWGVPTPDGYGGNTYADPVEIKVRWQDKKQIVVAQNGQEVISKAELLVTQDLDEMGMIWLGELSALPSEDDPITAGANEIKAISKIPMIKSKTEFVRTVYL